MTDTVYDKTDQGREEIATRAHHLAPRLRTLLLLVDGKRATTELMVKVGGLGLDEKALVELLEGGFIAIAGSRSNESVPTTLAPQQIAVTGGSDENTTPPRAGNADDRRQTETGKPAAGPDAAGAAPAPTTPAPTPASTASQNPAMPSGAAVQGILREGETQIQALYNFFNETIRSAIGLRGYGMQLKVERAGNLDDFRALRAPYLAAVLKAKGPELEHSLRNRLDQLLNL